jgi:hypothetical protein
VPRRRGIHARPLQAGGADVRAADCSRLLREAVVVVHLVVVEAAPLAAVRPLLGAAVQSALPRSGVLASADAMAIPSAPNLTIAINRIAAYQEIANDSNTISVRALSKFL